MPGQPENTDRYTVKPGAEAGDWCVWDTQRDAPVFGAGELTEDRARTLARRLSEAYQREVTGQSKGGA